MGNANVSIRVNRTHGYTTISTHHLRNKNLSLKAKGLMSVLLATPPGWNASVAGCAATCKDGRDAITSALKELEKEGYVFRLRKHDDFGRFIGMEYIVNELPTPPPQSSEEKPEETKKTPFTDFPSTGKPSAGKPMTENPQQYNNLNNLLLKESKPPIVPQQGDEADRLFEKFWAAYPKKKAKQNAVRAWKRAKVTVELFGIIMRALDQEKRSSQWTRDNGQYIPYPASWLNAKRWEDEPDSVPPPLSPPQMPQTERMPRRL